MGWAAGEVASPPPHCQLEPVSLGLEEHGSPAASVPVCPSPPRPTPAPALAQALATGSPWRLPLQVAPGAALKRCSGNRQVQEVCAWVFPSQHLPLPAPPLPPAGPRTVLRPMPGLPGPRPRPHARPDRRATLTTRNTPGLC